MLGPKKKQNNTVKLTLNELLCGFLGESLLIFHDQSEQVLSTSLIYWPDNAVIKLLSLFEIKLRAHGALNSLHSIVCSVFQRCDLIALKCCFIPWKFTRISSMLLSFFWVVVVVDVVRVIIFLKVKMNIKNLMHFPYKW